MLKFIWHPNHEAQGELRFRPFADSDLFGGFETIEDLKAVKKVLLKLKNQINQSNSHTLNDNQTTTQSNDIDQVSQQADNQEREEEEKEKFNQQRKVKIVFWLQSIAVIPLILALILFIFGYSWIVFVIATIIGVWIMFMLHVYWRHLSYRIQCTSETIFVAEGTNKSN